MERPVRLLDCDLEEPNCHIFLNPSIRKRETIGISVPRADSGDERAAEYCRRENIRVLLEVREGRRVAEAYSRGRAAVEAVPAYRRVFQRLWDDIEEAADSRRTAGRVAHADS
jgi:MinD superfamily P-loop ATPase